MIRLPETRLLPFGMCFLLLLAACGNNNHKADPTQLHNNAQEAVRLFFQSCVAEEGDNSRIASWAAKNGFHPLDAEAVGRLPLGMIELDAQNVWQGERGGALFYLTSGSGGDCSLKTAQADEAVVRAQFTAAAQQDTAGITVRERGNHYSATPFPFSQLVYSWQRGDEAVETLLGANTSPSEQVPAQVALHFSRAPMAVIVPNISNQ